MTSSRKVLITGGTSGIGRAFVDRFARNGDTVWFTYFQGSENPADVASAYPKNEIKYFSLNLAEYDSVSSLVESLPDTPDILIHNAGLGSKTVEKIAIEPHLRDQALIQVNSIGTLWLNNLLVPRMVKRNSGKVILISSVGGGITQVPGFHHADGMSKAAIAFLGRILAADLAQTGVDVFTICPGATDTPMFNASTLNHLSDSEKRKVVAALPKGRLIEPAEIAELGFFLASDASRILHGAVIDASMGLGVNPGLLQKE